MNLKNQGCANAFVLAGANGKERTARLAEVPERQRAGAKIHVQTVFAIRNKHKGKRK